MNSRRRRNRFPAPRFAPIHRLSSGARGLLKHRMLISIREPGRFAAPAGAERFVEAVGTARITGLENTHPAWSPAGSQRAQRPRRFLQQHCQLGWTVSRK